MEIQLVHTTGSPSRQDSDSESSYDKNRQLKSSSEMALHRKQSRRCKKQMSERQRRKRMNNSMDKLGLLVYGKSFKDGLKVDKATLLKDAYERLQTMKDDYHKGYETAITSTQTFLDHLDGCPQGVKDALTRHLHTTLQHHLHRCHSTPHPPEDTLSDSCSPRPMNSTPMEARSGQEILRDADQASLDLGPKGYQPMYMAPAKARTDTPRSARFGSSQDGVRSVPLGADLRPSPSAGVIHDVKPPCRPVTDFRLSPSLGAVHDVKPPRQPVADFKLSPSLAAVHDVEPPCRPAAELKTSSCRTTPGVGTPTFRAVGEAVLLSAYTHADASSGRGEGDDKKSSTVCPPLRVSAITTASSSRSRGSWDSANVQSAEPRTPRQGHSGPYCPLTYPFPYLYTPSSPCSSTPRISPYVTHFAPQDPLYLGSTPPALAHSFPITSSPSQGPEVKPSPFLLSAHPHPAPHPLPAHTPAQHAGHTQARCGGSSSRRAAEDSGYMSAVVPSPFTPQNVAQYGGVKKRYLREMVRGERGMEETDEENDKEVERVFSTGGKYDSDTGSGFSE